MINIEEKIKLINTTILNKVQCEAIVLFGSYSRGTQNNESDIDIAIKPENEISKKDLFYLSQELEDIIKNDIDLVNLDDINEILINGKTIFCKDEFKFEMYKLDMYREYLELNESRKAIIDNIKRGEN